jgi:hypothetical protein
MRRITPLALGLCFALGSSALAAQCVPTAQIMSILTNHQEAPTWRGDVPGGVVVLYQSEKPGGTFTIVFHSPSGTSCHIASGDGYAPMEANYLRFKPRS